MQITSLLKAGRLHVKTVLLLLSVTGAWLFCILFAASAIAADEPVNCDAHKGACSQAVGNAEVTLEIEPRPVTAMQDLLFRVSLSGAAAAEPVHIDLGMSGMKMGPNRVVLGKTASGQYEGRGVIVKCPSGRRTWHAIVTVPGLGEAEFVFDVVY